VTSGEGTNMPRRFSVLAALCLLGVSSFCFVATQSAVAKHKSSGVAKYKPSVSVKKHKSVAAKKRKQKSHAAKKHKSSVAETEATITIPRPRTPDDKQDCIAAAQAFYAQAGSLSRRTRQTIPQEFERVVSKLDEFCGEEEFEKARISIDWMNTCLQNFTSDQKALFCVRNDSYFCAVDPQSSACITSERRAGN
jgi:hypothetical protein